MYGIYWQRFRLRLLRGMCLLSLIIACDLIVLFFCSG